MIEINDFISYIPASDNPLSADAVIIRGNRNTYVFDVGNNDASFEEISHIEGSKIIFLSHFHPDHIGNISRLEYEELYQGDNTFKYTGKGEVIRDSKEFEDGIKIRAFAIPSSHAKGSLAIEVNDEYAFMGDSIYCTTKKDIPVYNAQLLNEEIKLIKNMKAANLFLSHERKPIKDKRVVLRMLEAIYDRRDKNSAYIEASMRQML